jgi:hypothetical protein
MEEQSVNESVSLRSRIYVTDTVLFIQNMAVYCLSDRLSFLQKPNEPSKHVLLFKYL